MNPITARPEEPEGSYDRESPSLPLVGRRKELELFQALFERAETGNGGMLILTGGSGMGKSRLLRTAAAEAERMGWRCVIGRAYPVESGIPYAPVTDAFGPLLRGLTPESLAKLTRGGEAELRHLFPTLRGQSNESRVADGVELRTRLLWNFNQFLSRLATRQPFLLILDDLHWADASSLELLHFVARQIGDQRVAIICAYNDEVGDRTRLTTMEESLIAIGAARTQAVEPLTHADTAALLREAFGASESVTREFTALLYGWTRGNPFFVEETIKSLVDTGRLRRRDGVWIGWDLTELDLPRSIRDAVRGRIRGLSSRARSLADLLAAVGTNVAHEVLVRLAGLPEAELVGSLDELRRNGLVEERLEGDEIVYDFSHPMVRDGLYAELGLARSRLLHGRIAEALEAYFGPRAAEHSDELAYHYARSSARELAPKAVRYLTAAGRAALAKYANREAADYLSAALDRAVSEDGTLEDAGLIEDLARARQRLGDFEGAVDLWHRRRRMAEAAGDGRSLGRIYRRLGLIEYWRARYLPALERFEAGLETARAAGDEEVQARLHLARGECWMELGRPLEAREEIEAALRLAEGMGRGDLLTRVHIALLLLHTWTGPPERARFHRDRAVDLARSLEDPAIECVAHWGASVLAGLTGEISTLSDHLTAARRLADELRSPLHQLRTAEPMIEFLANAGDWEGALALGERTLATARALSQRSPLARVLVWTALIHLGRGEIARGRAKVEEAWELSNAERAGHSPDVHTVVPAHVGRMAYHIATGDHAAAVRVGEAGLAIADRTGYTVWAIHRLLPTLAEAHLLLGDLDGAGRVGARLRADSERLGHTLGLAWADACDALLVWLRGDPRSAIDQLRAAADRLEAVPAIPDAARLRRHFAARLRDHGDREAALSELRRIHEIFVRLGAERELSKTREQIRELGARPPAREPVNGVDGLSPREAEIARLVAEGRTNKAIAKLLDISPRTVSTHLSNIFAKLGTASRGELAELVRRWD